MEMLHGIFDKAGHELNPESSIMTIKTLMQANSKLTPKTTLNCAETYKMLKKTSLGSGVQG